MSFIRFSIIFSILAAIYCCCAAIPLLSNEQSTLAEFNGRDYNINKNINIENGKNPGKNPDASGNRRQKRQFLGSFGQFSALDVASKRNVVWNDPSAFERRI